MIAIGIVSKETAKVVERYQGEDSVAYRLQQPIDDDFDVISNTEGVGFLVDHVPKCGEQVTYG
jgi:hypothetical protein